jgi:hypothetical protein
MSSIDRRRFPPSPGPQYRIHMQEQCGDARRRAHTFIADRSAS